MNKKLLLSLVAATVVSMPSISAQELAGTILQSQPKEENAKVPMATYGAVEANYAMPQVLANLGTHSMDDKPVCNMLARHTEINEGAFLWAPLGVDVVYKDQSTGNPSSWLWSVPGGDKAELTTQDAVVKYNKSGLYNMPTLTVDGTSTFTPAMTMTSAGGSEKVKTGGVAEITTIDMRIHGTSLGSIIFPENATYSLGAMAYGSGEGFLGGSNTKNIKGWGNLFMVGQDDTYLDGVNVYFYKKPTKYVDGAKLTLQVWLPTITDSYMILTAMPLNGAYIKYTDIKADGEDGAWALTYDGAVANVVLDEPIDLYGKPYFFISIEGFSDDPATDDLCLLTDLKGKKMNEVEQSNLLSHNSFARQNGESDYMRPVASYGGGNATFAICPVIRSAISEAGVEGVAADKVNEFNVTVAGKTLNVESTVAGTVYVYDLAGKIVATTQIAEGASSIAMDNVANGIYLVKGPQGKAHKVIMK